MRTIPVDLLETFVAVARAGSFTGAARALDLRQSTVSQKIARLEHLAGRRLIERDTHSMALSVDGEVLLEQAKLVLEAHARLTRSLTRTPLRGQLRIGASEDFVLSALPDVLAAFARRHPEVDLTVRAGLSIDLYEAYDAGKLDLLFVKRRNGDRRGALAWREPIAWLGKQDLRLDPHAPLPLLLYPPPSVTRAQALETLERTGRSWRIAFTSDSLAGLSAAARAGIGIMPHSARLLPAGLAVIEAGPHLPPLPEMEFVVIGPGGHDPAAQALMEGMLQWANASARLGN